MQLKYFCFHWQVCFFFFGYLCIRFGFFGAPYNGVYKFSAVFFPGVELETKVYCCPVKDGGLDRNCAVNLHNWSDLDYTSPIG